MTAGIASEETKRFVSREGKVNDTKIYPQKYWCYNPLSESNDCCFWHFLFYPNGGPERDGVFHPVYEYEQEVLEYLEKGKIDSACRLVAIYKATGLGITEFVLTWILWKVVTDDFFQKNEDVVIFTGPNIELSKKLIERLKHFADNRVEYIDHGMYKIQIGRANIQAYPSNNIDAVRGIPRVSLVFGDESAFFTGLKDDKQIRIVGERYVGKSNAYIIWVSTAGDMGDGFFFDIKEEVISQYKRFHFYEEAGLKKDPITGTSIFSDKFIEEARKLPSHPQEYLGVWGANVGDIYSTDALKMICADDFQIDYEKVYSDRIGFCDPGFGTSKFGIVISEMRNGIPYIVYSKSYKRESATSMIREIGRLADLFACKRWGCDKANPEIIKDMRETLFLNVTGVSNKEQGKKMTLDASTKVQKGKVRIHPRFTNLKNQLMSIKYGNNGQPKKTDANPFDEGDAFQGNLYLRTNGTGFISVSYDQSSW